MTDSATTALREQRHEDAGSRRAAGHGLDDLVALRDRLAGRVAALDDEVERLRAAVDAVAGEQAPAVAPRPVVVPDAPALSDAPVAAEPARRRRLVTLPGVLFVTGTLAVVDCAVTLAWQEPVSAIYGAYHQGRLDDELVELDRSFSAAGVGLAPEQERMLRRASSRETGERRMARLAASLQRRLKPGRPLGRLRIERLGTSDVVVEGTGGEALRRGPGRYASTSLPGLDGTFGVAGHRTSWSAPFRHIDRLRRGDRIVVTMPYGRFTYVVTTRRIVRPADVWVLRGRSRPRIVLTACHPLFSAAKRIVVSAELRTATPRGAAVRSG